MIRLVWLLELFVVFLPYVFAANDVVINEIYYHPPEDVPTEFIELYNPTSKTIDLSGYAFTDGVAFSFPSGTTIRSHAYVLVVRDPSHRAWRNISKTGPFIGKLSNSGESIILRSPDGTIVDSMTYSDDPPWSRGADGYGATLERISPNLMTDDHHSWRASLQDGGTPARVNTVNGTPPKPTIVSYQLDPPYPSSADAVQAEIFLDGSDLIASASLLVEVIRNTTVRDTFTLPMSFREMAGDISAYYAEVPKQPSQSLIRFGLNVKLLDGQEIRLPHVSEPRPFESYFVYDEIPARLPILWMYPGIATHIQNQTMMISGAVYKPLGNEPVLVRDGARVINSRNGQKIKFIKGEELLGNRTLNIIPERPGGGTTAGPQSPHVEQLSFRIFEDFGVLSLQSEWLRVIERGNHTQRIYVQQPNEQFLRINNRDADGNIYKIAYNEPGGYSKKTNLDEGDDDYRELFKNVNRNNRTNLSESLRKYLVIDEIMGYEVALNLMSHWDGIKNNMFLYHNPSPIDQWEIIPWDLDKTFGFTDSDPMFWKMPVDFPLTGHAPGSPELINRNLIGPISRPFHMDPELHQEYVRRVKEALDGLFSEERIGGMIDEKEQLLLDDLDLLESYTGSTRRTRRNQITESYDTMRFFLHNRHQFLRTHFPTSFMAERILPRNTYQAGSTIVGIQVVVQSIEEKGIFATVKENIPDRFSVSNVRANTGIVSISSNTITWSISDFTGEAVLTYDLTAPLSNPPFKATLEGTAADRETEYPIADSEIQYSLPSGGLDSDWVVGAGLWAVTDGVLTCYSDSNTDPKHVWVGRNFGTGDYTVKADVRMVDWENQDLARAGVAVRVNPNDGERGLNLLFHNDTGSVDLLNDLVAWGTNGDYSWEIGEWYTMILQAEGARLLGRIRKTGANEKPFQIVWEDPRLAQRSPGYPGLTGSSLNGLTSQFDNFEVLVNGKVVFSDTFDSETKVMRWEIY